MSTYKVGNGSQQIKLAVDIDTIGLAASRAIVVDLRSRTPAIAVAHSDNATGDIVQKQIGMATALAGKRHSIMTKIDLIGDDLDAKKIECDRLTGKYFLDFGEEGHKEFDDPIKTVATDFSTVILFKVIDLIP